MSSFLLGYAATQIIGGKLSDRYSGRRVLIAGLALWSLCTLATPPAAAHSCGALMVVRCLMGLGQGVAFPAIHSMVARSVPRCQRARAVGGIMSAAFAGSALAFGLSPAIIDAAGWPAVFYSFSSLSVVWMTAAMYFKNAGTRQDHQHQEQWKEAPSAEVMPRADPLHARGNVECSTWPQSPPDMGVGPMPAAAPVVGFWPLMKRREVWAIAAAQYASAWTFFSMLAWLPTFLAEHCGVAIGALGAYAAVPYMLQGCVAAGAGMLGDTLLARGVSVRTVRTGSQCVALLAPALCFFASVSPLTAGSPELAAGLIALGMGASALQCSEWLIAYVCLILRHNHCTGA